jgi:hypothetical protein
VLNILQSTFDQNVTHKEKIFITGWMLRIFYKVLMHNAWPVISLLDVRQELLRNHPI